MILYVVPMLPPLLLWPLTAFFIVGGLLMMYLLVTDIVDRK